MPYLDKDQRGYWHLKERQNGTIRYLRYIGKDPSRYLESVADAQEFADQVGVPRQVITYWFAKNGTPSIVGARRGNAKNGTPSIVGHPTFLSWSGSLPRRGICPFLAKQYSALTTNVMNGGAYAPPEVLEWLVVTTVLTSARQHQEGRVTAEVTTVALPQVQITLSEHTPE